MKINLANYSKSYQRITAINKRLLRILNFVRSRYRLRIDQKKVEIINGQVRHLKTLELVDKWES